MLRRLFGFGGAPLLSSLATFLILPIVSRVAGAESWGGFATGQTIGLLGAVVVRFGWGIIGPVRIAETPDQSERAAILEESLGARLLICALALPAAAGLTWWVVTGPAQHDAVFVAMACALGGLSPSWFCIGAGRPGDLITYDVLPRLLATGLAVPLILWSRDLYWYPLLLAAATILGAIAHRATIVSEARRIHFTWASSKHSIRTTSSVAGLDAIGNAYGSTALPIASVGLAPVGLSSFASADRLYRFGLMVVEALGNAFQAWVLEPGQHRRGRQMVALGAHVGLGVSGLVGLSLLGPWASELIFGSDVVATTATCVMLGLSYFAISAATPLVRNVLVPHRCIAYIFRCTVTAAALGVTVMLISASRGSAVGVAAGMAASEILILILVALRAVPLMGTDPPKGAAPVLLSP